MRVPPALASRLGKAKWGFVYTIMASGNRPVLDVGSAAGTGNLLDRLRNKRRKVQIKGPATHAYVHHVAELPSKVRGQRRLVVIHELWRKFQLRHSIRGYKAWQWWFDESDELDNLEELVELDELHDW
jgi:hypothetical protein